MKDADVLISRHAWNEARNLGIPAWGLLVAMASYLAHRATHSVVDISEIRMLGGDDPEDLIEILECEGWLIRVPLALRSRQSWVFCPYAECSPIPRLPRPQDLEGLEKEEETPPETQNSSK